MDAEVSDAPKEPQIAKARDVYACQAVDRAFAVLRLLKASSCGLGFAEVAEALGLHRSTAHRFLKALERNGVVEQGESKLWRLKTKQPARKEG